MPFFSNPNKMEVILKKSKITSSILKQTLRSTEIDLKVGEILGWCLFNKRKYIVCYRRDIKGLSIYPLFKEIEFGKSFSPDNQSENVVVTWWVKVKLGGIYVPISYTTKDENEKDEFVKLLKTVKHNAESYGQFFL